MPAIMVAETASAVTTAPARGRMVIIVGRDRRVIVDAGVDAAALARVLDVLERRCSRSLQAFGFGSPPAKPT